MPTGHRIIVYSHQLNYSNTVLAWNAHEPVRQH